jgi:hypothetical protein
VICSKRKHCHRKNLNTKAQRGITATKNNGIRLDACRRMKSATDFFDGKIYIGWNLSSVGEKDK